MPLQLCHASMDMTTSLHLFGFECIKSLVTGTGTVDEQQTK
jgi:hypothetical protein